jgi:hypothetical protein
VPFDSGNLLFLEHRENFFRVNVPHQGGVALNRCSVVGAAMY